MRTFNRHLLTPIFASLLFSGLSCQSESAPLTKTETILSDATVIQLDNQMGKIKIKVGDKPQYSYQKKKWKEWCSLNHREKEGVLEIKVVNSSFTGSEGCELHWDIILPPSADLALAQEAGEIIGKGALRDLKIDLAAGNILWENSKSPFKVKLAAGNVTFKNATFINGGESEINVATGNVSVSSPPETEVVTQMNTAMGVKSNSFEREKKGKPHRLKINVALGKADHRILEK